MKLNLRRYLSIATALIVFIGLIPLTAWWLINDVAASQWLLQQVFGVFSQQMSVDAVRGRLRDGIELENFKFHSDSQNIQLKRALLRWQLEELSSGLLKINELNLDGITVVMTKTEEESEFDPLAKIELPLQITLDNFVLTNLQLKQDKDSYQVDKLQFSAETLENQLYLHSLTVQGQGLTATVKGKTKLGEGFAFGLNIAWQFNSPKQGQWHGTVTAKGDSAAVSFDNQISSPFILQQQGRVENLMLAPVLTTNGRWQNLRWPLTGKTVQISSKAGDFNVSGSAQKYQLQLHAQLSQARLAQAQLQFNGNGTDQDLHIAQLNLHSRLGQLQVKGDVGWQKAPHFDVQAIGEHFNPAIVMPGMAGDLSFKTALKGQLLAEKLQFAINIDHLTGKLRNYPVLAQGQLNLVDKQLDIKTMKLASGANKFSVHGALGEKNAALDIAVSAPKLNSLWPTLGGQLTADAHLQGELSNPAVQLKAKGKQLHFEQHAVKDIAINLNYTADALKKSQLQFSAAGLSSGATKITQLTISGQGLKQQHSFTAQVNSEQGSVNLALTGGLQNNNWQARLSELNINQPRAGRWQLTSPVALAVSKHSTGMDVLLGESCFGQAAAIFCMQGSYPANGDFQGAFHASLPDELAQKYLPATVKLTGQLTAAGAVQKTLGGLTGHYQLSMSSNTKVSMTIDKQQTTIPFNQVLLAGTLQGTQVNNDLNILFADKNYLRGQLRVDTGTTQAMSGQLFAGIADFALLTPYISPLSDLKGNLTAAVDIAGTLVKPALTGNVLLNNTTVTAEQAGIRIQDINLKLHSLASNPEQVLISGGLKSGEGMMNLTGKVQLNPDAGYPAELLISGNQFEAVKLPQAQVTVSPELNCKYANNKGAVSGKLTLAKAQIQMEELPANATVPSEDEQIVGENKNTQKSVPAPQIGVDIVIDLGKQTHFSGLGLNTDLIGNLKLTKKAQNLVMFGNVDMQNARYKSYGQDLTVRRGRFVFNGPPASPMIDVEAIRLSKSQKVTAILKLTGPVQSPQTQISSEPSLPESDALAYLVTGRALNQLTKSDGNMLASAALSYGAGKVAWLAEKFGIDEIEVEEGESMKDSLMAVGQYLTPDFYVGAKVGLFNKQPILTMKYKITEGLSISTQAGESQRVYINYEFSHK